MKKVVMTMLTAALFAAAGCALMGPEYEIGRAHV